MAISDETGTMSATMNGQQKNQTKPENLEGAERAEKALALRIRGLSYRAIGKKLSCDPSTAYRHVADALAATRERCKAKADELREIELEKLDRIEREMNRRLKGADDQDAAKLSRLILKTQERRSKLLGMDAPQKLEMSGNLYTVASASPECDEWGKPRT